MQSARMIHRVAFASLSSCRKGEGRRGRGKELKCHHTISFLVRSTTKSPFVCCSNILINHRPLPRIPYRLLHPYQATKPPLTKPHSTLTPHTPSFPYVQKSPTIHDCAAGKALSRHGKLSYRGYASLALPSHAADHRFWMLSRDTGSSIVRDLAALFEGEVFGQEVSNVGGILR